MLQDLNPSACSSLVILMHWACKRQGSTCLMLWPKCSSGMCAKLHTVAATNNGHHPTRSLYYCLFAPQIFVCCSSRTSHSWWIAHLMQRQLRGCNDIPSFVQRTAPIARSFCEGCTWHHLHTLVSPSGKCAKFHTVAANNNRDPTSCSFYFCSFEPHTSVLFFTHIPFVVNVVVWRWRHM